MFFQYRLNCGCRNKNAFPLRKQLRKMSKIGIKVLFLIKRDDTFSDILRESCGWFAPPVAVNKESFSLFFISFHHTVNLPSGNRQFQSGVILIPAGFHKFLNNLVFFLFLHPKFNLLNCPEPPAL